MNEEKMMQALLSLIMMGSLSGVDIEEVEKADRHQKDFTRELERRYPVNKECIDQIRELRDVYPVQLPRLLKLFSVVRDDLDKSVRTFTDLLLSVPQESVREAFLSLVYSRLRIAAEGLKLDVELATGQTKFEEEDEDLGN